MKLECLENLVSKQFNIITTKGEELFNCRLITYNAGLLTLACYFGDNNCSVRQVYVSEIEKLEI